jgi:AraC-like DNA-binding protein
LYEQKAQHHNKRNAQAEHDDIADAAIALDLGFLAYFALLRGLRAARFKHLFEISLRAFWY